MNAVMLMMRDTLGPPLNTQVHWEARPSGPVPSRSSLTSHSFTSGAFPQIVVSAIVIVGHRVILFLWLALSSPRPAATPLLARRGAGGEDSGFPSPAHGGGVRGGGFSTTKALILTWRTRAYTSMSRSWCHHHSPCVHKGANGGGTTNGS